MSTTAMPLVADPLDRLEHVLGLHDAQGRGGLVEEHHLVRPGDGPGDGDPLPLPTGHCCRPATTIDRTVAPSSSKPALACLRIALLSMKPNLPEHALAPGSPGRGTCSAPGRGAGPARGPGTPPRCRARMPACGVAIVTGRRRRRSRRQSSARLPESALTSVDFPAPLSPIRATTSPGLDVEITVLRARTLPKLRAAPYLPKPDSYLFPPPWGSGRSRPMIGTGVNDSLSGWRFVRCPPSRAGAPVTSG